MAFGLYIHIPFCVSKCKYCDFYSLGHSKTVPENYVDAIIYRLNQHKNTTFDTVYFGGGTPSLLTGEQVNRILNNINRKDNCEITLEVNPETVTSEKLNAYYNCGVNRLSMGLQTAHDDSLKRIGRVHSAKTASDVLNMAKNIGFENISGDIMLSLPYYSNKEFDDTLSLLANGGVTHISSYILKIEPSTPFGINPPLGLPTDDETADFYLYSVEKLKEYGFNQYEISNFAKQGFESKHNLLYWDCENYLGVGPAAHSCIEGKRYYYPKSLNSFLDVNTDMIFDDYATHEDYIMLQLRLNKGLDFKALKELYNIDLLNKNTVFISNLVKNNYASFDDDILKLTPSGMLIQNSILCNLL